MRSFSSGAEAMAAIQAGASQAPDLLITDYDLPHHNGYELAQHAKQRWPNLPALLITAGYIANAKQHEIFDAVMLKPIEIAELRRYLSAFCSTEAPPTQHLTATKEEPTHDFSLLNEEEMEALKELLSLNAISDIIHWCETLAEQRPELAPLAEKISQTAKNFDLKRLKKLLERL